VRVSTAFNKMLAIPGASVTGVRFGRHGIVVTLRKRASRLRCPCGFSTRSRYDASVRRWRHLDLGANKLFLETEIRRLTCRRCRAVRTEDVPWARPRARHTRDFEDTTAWLAQRTDKTAVARFLRCSWRAVDDIVTRVVADHLDERRLDDLYRIGVDEISWRRGHCYLTLVADHDRPAVVWVAEERTTQALQAFFDELGPDRCAQIQAITMDMSPAYRKAAATLPNARVCFDPFHVVRLVNEALDTVFSQTSRELGLDGRSRQRMRFALRRAEQDLSKDQRSLLLRVRRMRHALWRAWELKESFRDLYRIVDPEHAAAYLTDWLRRASRSKLRPFVFLAHRLRKRFDGIVAAVELGLSNSRLEGFNAKARVIQRRGYGFPNPKALAAMIYLCCGRIEIRLPTES
jgi:transposase